MLKNTITHYGNVTKILHWLSALTVVALFILGLWMVELTYYSAWYKTAPHWHKSVGILLLLATVFRMCWRIYTPTPNAIASHSAVVKFAAKLAHLALYFLLIILMLTGYLISTADDRAIEVFNWFSIPALGELFNNQADIAGLLHQYLAYGLMILSAVHALAAIKHHVIDKDQTLKRMT